MYSIVLWEMENTHLCSIDIHTVITNKYSLSNFGLSSVCNSDLTGFKFPCLQFAGDVALKVVAVDPDSGLNGDVYYSMVESPKYPETEEDIFTINSNTGKTYGVCVTFL